MRVLLIAEAANPEWVSVPLIGWSLSKAISKRVDAHLVTHVRNRDAVRRAGLVEGRDFTAIDNERIAGPAWRLADRLRGGAGKGWTTMAAFSALSYYSFERHVWRRFAERLRRREFALVHRITPLSPTHQSPIARRLKALGVPFVIGPLNGGVPWPPAFRDRQHAEREWLSHVRALYKAMPAYRATRRDAAAILVGARHAFLDLPRWAQAKGTLIPENGFDPARFTASRTRSASLPLRGVFIGRLVPLKGVDMLLEAAAGLLRDGAMQMEIVGDGPQKEELAALCAHLGIGDRVPFRGWLPHEQVQDILRDSDFMALPSIREFGGGVVIEAMAMGVAPIVADYGGPAELVSTDTGIAVPFTDRESLVAGLRAVLDKIVARPAMLDELGAAALRKARRDYTWDAKAKRIVAIYESVLAAKT